MENIEKIFRVLSWAAIVVAIWYFSAHLLAAQICQ